MLEVGLLRQLRKSLAQESKQFSFRKADTGETCEFLDESFLIRATVKNPSDMRRSNVTKGSKRKAISAQRGPNLSLRKIL